MMYNILRNTFIDFIYMMPVLRFCYHTVTHSYIAGI